LTVEPSQIDFRGRRPLYAIGLRFLTLIAVVVIAFILFVPSFLLSYPTYSLPWNEEYRILPPGKIPTKTPTLDQPKITETLRYKTTLYFDGSPRGELNFVIYPQGVVKGIWNGEYDRSGELHCIVLASSFSGNTDPSKPCIEENRHNASKLYFLTSGTFTLLETGLSGRNHGINGLVYVCGWLDPNYTATGEIYVTENKKSFDVFSWSADPIN
jgi:hypothetical protein